MIVLRVRIYMQGCATVDPKYDHLTMQDYSKIVSTEKAMLQKMEEAELCRQELIHLIFFLHGYLLVVVVVLDHVLLG